MKAYFDRYIRPKKWFARLQQKLTSLLIGRKNQKLPAYLFIKTLFKNIDNNAIQDRAAGVSFSLTLSLFPFLLFLITLIPYTPLTHEEVMVFMNENLPRDIFSVLSSTIHDIMLNKRTSLLSFSFILALYAATNGMSALTEAFNSVYLYAEERSFIKQRGTALLLTIVISFIFLFSVIALIISRFVIDYLSQWGFISDGFLYAGIIFAKYLIVFSVFFFAISTIYYIAPASSERWSFFSLGSVLTSVATILVTNLFSFYLENFATYNKLYGSIGTFIALMIWIYLLSFLLIMGFEVNASWMEARKIYLKEDAKK